eukprot:6856538-Pyramimonas_sp.AAC.1
MKRAQDSPARRVSGQRMRRLRRCWPGDRSAARCLKPGPPCSGSGRPADEVEGPKRHRRHRTRIRGWEKRVAHFAAKPSIAA